MAELINSQGDLDTEKLPTILDSADVEAITLDSAQVTTIASTEAAATGLTVYSTLDSLPVSNLSSGDQAFVEGNKRLYISNGNGWYNVSLVNLSPTFDSDVNSTFSIIDSATPLIITNPASDSDNPAAIISYGGTMSDSGQYLVALTRDSSVWTFTPLSADSVYNNVTLGNLSDSDGGDFTYTFTASDGINQASKSITITYDGLAAYIPEDPRATQFATVNNMTAGKNMRVTLNSGFDQIDANETFTMEAYVANYQQPIGCIASSASGNSDNDTDRFYFGTGVSPNRMIFKMGSSYNYFTNNTNMFTGPQFHHICVHRPANSSSFYLAINGVQYSNQSITSGAIKLQEALGYLQIGGFTNTATWNMQGAVCDFRLSVGGTAPYGTSDFTNPKESWDEDVYSTRMQPHSGATWSFVCANDATNTNFQEHGGSVVDNIVVGTGVTVLGSQYLPRSTSWTFDAYGASGIPAAYIKTCEFNGSSNAFTSMELEFANSTQANYFRDKWNACRTAGNRLNTSNGGLGFHMGNEFMSFNGVSSAHSSGYVDMGTASSSGATVTCNFSSNVTGGAWNTEWANGNVSFNDMRTVTGIVAGPVYGFRFLVRSTDGNNTLRWYGSGGNGNSTLFNWSN